MWAEQDIDLVGIAYITMEKAGLEKSVAKIKDAGLTVADMIGLGPFRLDEPDGWTEARRQLEPIIDAAVELETGTLAFTPGWSGDLSGDDAIAAFIDAFGPLVEAAGKRGVAVSIENTSRFRTESGFIPNLAAAADVAAKIGAGVCVETHNCWKEPGLEQTFAEHAGRFHVIQLNDGVYVEGQTPGRAVPGDGNIPIERLVRLAVESGYTGVFELELIGPRIDEEGPAQAVARSLDVLDAMFESIMPT